MQKRFIRILILFFVLCACFSEKLFAQCGPGTPVFTVDLTGVPDSNWISPSIARNDTCCGVTAPDKCLKFIITLDSDAVAINFNIVSGAVPGGALFYQINCGPPQALGTPICLNGPGPHVLTFCKPGNNQNTYAITSIPGPTASSNIVINDGCIGQLISDGFTENTITWNSIAPGAPGTYNSYLSCTSGCDSVTVQAQAGFPPFVDYVVCGVPAAQCVTTTTCDTVRVTFNPTLFVNITPVQPTVCFGQTNTVITANGIGGTPPYTYSWNTGAATQSITVGAGTYLVILGDASGCPPTTDTVIVTSFANTITANAGPDIYVCAANPAAALNGSVTGVTTGVWSGGSGTFSPSATALNASYAPTAAEVAAGSVTLYLQTTNNGTCPPDADTVQVFFENFNATITPAITPPSCNGAANGSVSLSITGTFAPYTVAWQTTPPQSGTTATGLTAGTYSFTVTNSLGCATTQQVAITQPAGLNSLMNTANINCAGTSTGAATVTVSGGTPGYTYSWSPSGGTGSAISNAAAGNYIVTITDANGCTLTDTAVLTQPAVMTVSVSATAPSCAGQSNGTAIATAGGGTPGYAYQWVGTGITSSVATGLAAGTYSVNVTDASGCAVQGTVTITAPPPLALTVNKTNETCDNLNNGTASATVSGGTPAYSYLWQPGSATTQFVSGLAAGNYTVTVTDSKGCQILTVFSITQPNPLLASMSSVTNVSCFGAANGSVNASVTGGTPLYTYSWSPAPGSGQGTSTVSGLTAGTYTLTAIDAQGCVNQVPVAITQPSVLTSSINVTHVTCNSVNNGSLTASSSGGTSPYAYLWLPGNTTGSTYANLFSGTYTVMTTDANGCTASATATITQPSPIIVNTSSTNSNCGMADGTASVTTGGGVGPYTISWAPAGGSGATTAGVVAGSYTVTVTDALNCVDTATVMVNDNAGPTVSISSSTNVSCYGGNDGSATVSVSGGTGALTYQWSPYGGNGPTATGLTAGVYIVTVTDANGCQSQAVTSPPITEPPQLALTINPTAVSCNGGANGGANAIVSGGTPGYSYVWSPGGSTGSTVSGLSAGNYTVTVTDQNSCQISSGFVITQPAALGASVISTTSVSCFGGNNGSISVSASGGTGPYAYSWQPYGGGTAFATGLSAGTYTCTVTDSKGCTFTVSASVAQPVSPLFALVSNTAVSCFGGTDGTATATPSGGTGSYSYSWSPSGATGQTAAGLSAGTQFVTVTDANGCTYTSGTIIQQPTAVTVSVSTANSTCGNANGSAIALVSGGTPAYTYLWQPSGGTSSNASGLSAGNYTLIVTDSKNCVQQFPFTLGNTAGPSVTAGVLANVSCFGGNNGSASVSVSGGSPAFQYAWSPSGANTPSAGSLFAGTHQVIVYDVNGCSDTASVVITQPQPLTASVTATANVSCFGGNNGTLSAAVSGGTTPYTYSWSSPGGSGATLSSLGVGVYTVTVTDQAGCVAQATGSVTQPAQLSAAVASSANPSCFGFQNGSATAGVSGGTAPYTYSWNSVPAQTAQVATGLGAGTYSITITDANGCIAQASATLTQPTQIITAGGISPVICAGSSANITAGASGGSAPYTFYWTPGTTTGSGITVSPSATTTYSVTAYDVNGCPGTTDTLVVTVYVLNGANLVVTAASPICPGTSTVVYAQVSGTTGPLTYAWNNNLGSGPGGFLVTPTSPTTYICTVTNSCGVSVTDSVSVSFNPPPAIAFTSNVISGCVPLTVQFTDQSVPLSNDPIISWSWTFGDGGTSAQQNPSYTYNQPGVYNVILYVQTQGGCANSNSGGTYQVTVSSIPVASFSVNSTQLDLPYDQLVCTNLSTGATSYVWTFGDGSTSAAVNSSHLYANPGSYTVQLIATNAAGCADTASVVVEATTDIVFPNAFTPDPNGSNGGAYSYNDESNNVFFPFTAGVDSYHLLIFNRWGELIFESFDVKKGWDGYYRGVLCQQDVYIWKADVKFIGGKTFNKIGDVTLIR